MVSGGRDDNCVTADLSYKVDVHEFRPWIETAGEGRLFSGMCGARMWQGKDQEPKRVVLDIYEATPLHVMRFDVPANAVALRIAMNSEDNGNGQNDFDLLVYRGEPSPAAMPICSETGPGQFAFCEIKQPAVGIWSTVVKRREGANHSNPSLLNIKDRPTRWLDIVLDPSGNW